MQFSDYIKSAREQNLEFYYCKLSDLERRFDDSNDMQQKIGIRMAIKETKDKITFYCPKKTKSVSFKRVAPPF